MDHAWYRVPDEVVRPGDLVRLPPQYLPLREPVLVLHPSKMNKKGRLLGELLGHSRDHGIPAKVANGKSSTEFVVPGRFARFGVVLTRGCEIENGKTRQIVPVQPLTEIQGGDGRTAEENRATLIDGGFLSQHYLPEVPPELGGHFGDSYVDFRYIVTLRRELFDTLERPLSLTRVAVYDLYFAWVRHATGQTVKTQGTCPSCGKTVPMLTNAPEVLFPPEDY